MLAILTPAYWLTALLLAALAVCWADVLVRPGSLLAPLQARWRGWYRTRYGAELDEAGWWPPVWGCPRCVAGQWGFWGYLLLFHAAPYAPLAHLGFAAITILLALLLQKWIY